MKEIPVIQPFTPPPAPTGELQTASLVNDPALLLTDEPTGNLDSKNGEAVLQLFYELNAQGRTIVMVTHNPDIAARLPRVVEMRDGIVQHDRGAGAQPDGAQPDGARSDDARSDDARSDDALRAIANAGDAV